MVRRSLAGIALATWAVLSLVPAALAGGWAVTTLDALPTELGAGVSYQLGYTILQHGITPYRTDDTSVRIRSVSTGETHVFAGRPDGPAGHYVVDVRFPTAGEWVWEVQPGIFQAQQLGTVSVIPATAAPGTTGATADQPASLPAAIAPASANGLAGLRLALLVATSLAAGVFALQLAAYARHGRPEQTAAMPPLQRAAKP